MKECSFGKEFPSTIRPQSFNRMICGLKDERITNALFAHEVKCVDGEEEQ